MMGITECTKCGREFETTFTDNSYYIEGYRKPEYDPDEEDCDFCRGEETCEEKGCGEQATVLDTEGNVYYCSKHWEEGREGSDCTPEEWEEFAHRLEPELCGGFVRYKAKEAPVES